MEQKKITRGIYVILVVAAVFALGYFVGSGRTSRELQVTVQQVQESADQPVEETDTAARAAVINLNTADQEELELLPGIGPELAQRIIAYREKHGGFDTKEQIMEVEGIGEKRYSKLEYWITVEESP